MTSPHPEPAESRVDPDAGCPRAAFDAALVEYRDELVEYLRSRLRDQETAADLAQETLSRMMKYRDSPEIEDRRLMLFRIANNLVNEHHRTRQRRYAGSHYSLDETEPLRATAPSVEAIVDARQALDTLLKRTITGLPPKCRLAFMLSRFDGQSYPQIAERMGISVKMVEKHITKALLACRAAVGDFDV
jgi:RNA polymerase sigma-70 factor (ECF subfamily)